MLPCDWLLGPEEVVLRCDWLLGPEEGPVLVAVMKPRPCRAQLYCHRPPGEGKAAVQGLQAAAQGL